MPKVSVVIPTYNRPELLPKAVRSVLAQTFEDFEIIIVDDGLKERAGKVVATFSDPRIRYIQHEVNKGCAGAKNTGARNAKGEYVAFLDDDDVWLPLKLEKQVAALNGAPPDVAFCFTGAYEVFDNRKIFAEALEGLADYHNVVLRDFSAIHGSMLMYRTKAFLELGGINESYPTHTDVEFLIRFTRKYRGIGINEPLVERKLESDHTQMGSNIENRIKGRHMILEEFKDEFEKHPTFRAKHIERLAKFYRQIGKYKEARHHFLIAFRLEPRLIRFLYVISLYGDGAGYRMFRRIKRAV